MKAGQRLKVQMGFETVEERKKRVALEKKEIEKKKKYFDKVLNPKVEKEIKINTKAFKRVLWKEGGGYFAKMNRKFTVHENNSKFLKLISLYFSENSDFENVEGGELRKGLLIQGASGTGKTSVFNIIQEISRKYNLPQIWYKNISVLQVVREFNMGGEVVLGKYIRGKVHFDDLGAENIANCWGIREELMKRILEIRYNLYIENGTKTYLTTNLELKDIKARYGGAVYDRLFEMFNFLELKGETRRY